MTDEQKLIETHQRPKAMAFVASLRENRAVLKLNNPRRVAM